MAGPPGETTLIDYLSARPLSSACIRHAWGPELSAQSLKLLSHATFLHVRSIELGTVTASGRV